MVEIRQLVEPDIEVVINFDSQYSNSEYYKYSVLFKQQMLVVQACNKEGMVGRYEANNGKYYGLRLINENIEVCIPESGWIPIYEEIQEKHNNKIADKTILGD